MGRETRPIQWKSKIGNLVRLQLKLQFVRDKGDEFGIRGFSLGIADGIAEKSLECIQIAPVPGNFDGMPDGPLHSGRGGLECFRHLGVQYLGDGVGVLSARLGGFQKPESCRWIDWFLSCPLHNWFVGLVVMIPKSNFLVKFEGNKHLKKVFSE